MNIELKNKNFLNKPKHILAIDGITACNCFDILNEDLSTFDDIVAEFRGQWYDKPSEPKNTEELKTVNSCDKMSFLHTSKLSMTLD